MTPGDLPNDAVNKARQIEQHVSLIYWFTFDCTGMVFVDHTFYMPDGWNQGAPFRGLHPGVSSRILGFIPSWIGRTTTLTLNSMNMGTYMYVYIQYIYTIFPTFWSIQMTLSHFCCGNSMEIHSRVLCSSSKASELLTRVAQQQQQTQDAGGGRQICWCAPTFGCFFLGTFGRISQILPICHNGFPWGYPIGFRNWPESIYVSLYYVHI